MNHKRNFVWMYLKITHFGIIIYRKLTDVLFIINFTRMHAYTFAKLCVDQIMKQLDSLEPKVKPELDALLQRIQLDEQFSSVEESSEEDAAEQTKPVFRSQLLNRFGFLDFFPEKVCFRLHMDATQIPIIYQDLHQLK